MGTKSVETGEAKLKAEVEVARDGLAGFPETGVGAARVASRSGVGTAAAEGALQARTKDKALFFRCKFDDNRRFVKVKTDSDSRSQARSATDAHAAGGIAVADIEARYCAGEASAKFNPRPQNISTQPAIEDQGMYSVFGQFPPSGANPTVFICTFSADGELVGVDKQ